MNLLALVESPDHVCCRYRIRAFEKALLGAGWSLACVGLAPGPLGRVRQLLQASRFDAAIIQRKLLPSWQLRILRRTARHLVFDFDDAVMYRDSYDRRGPHCARRRRRFQETVRLADTVIAGNDFLADCALRAGAAVERVRVIPTCVEPNDYVVARHGHSPGPVDLVWIGSSSTLKGLEESRPIWQSLADAIPRLRLRVVCDRFPHPFPLAVVPIAWQAQTEARELATGQIGISWLPDDAWSRGKCGLKILQYQAAGLPVVANPVGAHCEMVHAGETGFLAAGPDDWVSAIRTLANDPGLRSQFGSAGRRQVETEYSLTAWSETFVAAVAGSGAKWIPAQIEISPRAALPGRPKFKARSGWLTSERTLNPTGDR
jgi:glycosyltransferase involved in cell wall biosynthesis